MYTAECSPGRRFRFNRRYLSEDGKRLYDLMVDAVRAESRTFDTGGILMSMPKVMEVYTAVCNDSPQFHWLGNEVSVTSSGRRMSVTYQTNRMLSERKRYASKMKAYAEDLFDSTIRHCRSEFEVELAVHDHICETVSYSKEDPSTAYTMIGPMFRGKGVCSGISMMNSFLLNCYGVRATVVSGNLRGDSEGHAWNLARVEGEWYHEDVTSDLNHRHSYFNMDDRLASVTHDFRLSERCVSRDQWYYGAKGLVFDTRRDIFRFLSGQDGRARWSEFFTNLPDDEARRAVESSLRGGCSYSVSDGRVMVNWC